MPSRRWNNARPTSLQHALELCVQHARDIHNRSVDRLADLCGLTNKWRIYKWIESGGIPAVMIRPFEHACGCEYVTNWLAASAHKLVINIPTGRRANEIELNDLQRGIHDAIGLLMRFYAGEAEVEETTAALTHVMEGLAWHRANAFKSAQPELDLEHD